MPWSCGFWARTIDPSLMLVIHNAKLHTLNPLQPTAQAIAIDGCNVLAVGGDDEILSSFSAENRFDASGRTIIPGLSDAHIHQTLGK